MRWLGTIDDPVAAGSNLETLAAIAAGSPAILAPTAFYPVTTGQVDPGVTPLERTDEIRGRRGDTAPISFRSDPRLTFEARAYPSLCRTLLRRALNGTVSSAGVGPAAITSTFGPVQTGSLKALVAWLVREGQLDRLTGMWLNEVGFDFPIDEEGSVSVEGWGLYHDTDDPAARGTDPNTNVGAALPTPGAGEYTAFTETYMLRDAYATRGATNIEITNLAGFGITFNNGLIDDVRSRYRPRKNIEKYTVDTIPHRLWYPNRHKFSAMPITGRIDLSDVDAVADLKRKLFHAEKLVFEVGGPALATTPVVDDVMRFTCYNHAPTGGGADPIAREGDQTASYEFTAYVDPTTGKDVEVSFVGAAALA